MNPVRLLTIGFTKKRAQRFFELLRNAGAKRVVDVRLHNASQLAGFAKRDDLAWFLREICNMGYHHLPALAPTKELLAAYRNAAIDWPAYEQRFLDLMQERRIEETVDPKLMADGCLLCSEDQPHHCHRRLVAEYLREHWGHIDVVHLGERTDTE